MINAELLTRNDRPPELSSLGDLRSLEVLAAQAGLTEFVLQPCDGLADAIERGSDISDAI